MKGYLFLFSVFSCFFLKAQEQLPEVLSFEEYMAYVKEYHPVAGQAELQISMGEAQLLKARGGFDPKIEVDYDRKEFKGTEYYDILNSTFKIPTWYGVEVKAGFEQNEGYYLNPQKTVPEDGLFSAGVSVDVGQGMWINDRMATLKSARAFRQQTLAERDLMVNQVLYNAAIAYFEWLKVYNEVIIYEEFLENAAERFLGVKQNARLGEVAAIDTVEAKIPVQSRTLELEQARVRLMKERLNLSNYLWLANNVPVELQPNIIPDTSLQEDLDLTLELPPLTPDQIDIEDHPKLRSLEFKLQALEIERRLKANKLLPAINLEYNFITPEPEFQTLNTANYKAGISLSVPLFLRKERGDLRLAELKVQDTYFDLQLNERQIENKIRAVFQELESYKIQNVIVSEMVENYIIMLAAEERKMSFGESSIFLINSREIKLIEAQLKQNEVLTKFMYAKARLFQSLGIIPELD
ncbi:TolC family protein [Zunongwangia sp. F260]|uniref:TolC family protein n=1 Tax=Autumnicola lenta TaxID=3075593 RepID=A0ABU3CNX2_9FLAO|nr:TolC family protein [Zunongwangia sp. F260]MDT0648049.1 TolC family protein [Zunongwangia sp. F260]